MYYIFQSFSNTRNGVGWRDSGYGTPQRALHATLLPVSSAQAKDWLIREQKAQSAALETSAVNEEAQDVTSTAL